MQARMKNPVMILGEAMQPLQAVSAAILKTGLSEKTFHLVHQRVSQVNGCSVCIDGGFRLAKRAGETDERLFAVAAWRHAPYFSDAERAALALAECVTRLCDRTDPVPDDVWNAAAKQFDQPQLAALLLAISMTNVWNRLNVATAQPAGEWKP